MLSMNNAKNLAPPENEPDYVVMSNADLGQHIRRLDKRLSKLGEVVDVQQQSIEGLTKIIKMLADNTSTPITFPDKNS